MGKNMTCNLQTCSLDKTPCPDSMNLQILNLFDEVSFDLLKTYFCLKIKIEIKRWLIKKANLLLIFVGGKNQDLQIQNCEFDLMDKLLFCYFCDIQFDKTPKLLGNVDKIRERFSAEMLL